MNDQIWPEICIFVYFGPGLAGSFGALWMGWLVFVARGLYLARHLYTLFYTFRDLNRLIRGELLFYLFRSPSYGGDKPERHFGHFGATLRNRYFIHLTLLTHQNVFM